MSKVNSEHIVRLVLEVDLYKRPTSIPMITVHHVLKILGAFLLLKCRVVGTGSARSARAPSFLGGRTRICLEFSLFAWPPNVVHSMISVACYDPARHSFLAEKTKEN